MEPEEKSIPHFVVPKGDVAGKVNSMAVSEKQLEANRRNARKSTGPKTPEGKNKAGQNALKHGMTARNLLVGEEQVEELEALRQGLWEALQPQDAVEEMLVEQLVELSWRRQRGRRVEAASIALTAKNPIGEGSWDPEIRRLQREVGMVDHPLNELLRRYETSLENRFFKTLSEFYKYRHARQTYGLAPTDGKPIPLN